MYYNKSLMVRTPRFSPRAMRILSAAVISGRLMVMINVRIKYESALVRLGVLAFTCFAGENLCFEFFLKTKTGAQQQLGEF